MANKAHWTKHHADGILEVRISKWRWFADFINTAALTFPGYVYRGQAASKWKLESRLDRELRKAGTPAASFAEQRTAHLERFKFAARGRRGPTPAAIQSSMDWWALGQHFGLATPLLDWTASPYVAAYFAFADASNDGDSTRAVFGLHAEAVVDYSNGRLVIHDGHAVVEDSPQLNPPIKTGDGILWHRPQSDDNPRLVSQSGCFTYAPPRVTLEEWVRKHFQGCRDALLVKLMVPNSDRVEALTSLNRMNINHLSLFPDLYGSSKHCNLSLTIPDY